MLLVFLANAICVLLASTIPLILVCRTAQMKNPRRYILAAICLEYFLWSLNNYILPAPSSAVEFWLNLLLFALTWYYALPKQRTVATLSIIVYLAAKFLATFVLSLVVYRAADSFHFSTEEISDPHTFAYALMCLVAACVTGPAMYLSHLILKKLLNHRTLSHWLLLILPVPLSQSVLVNIILRLVPYSYQVKGIWTTMVLGILFSILADICFFIGIFKIRKADQLESQVRMAEEQLNTQTGYHRQLQDNILSVNQIRHDLNNQLQAAYYLLEQGESAQVRKQLDVLRESIREKVGPSYSSNLMVDAVLSEKALRCQELGIRLNVSTEIPSELPIENAHLCSAFSNLLDNSIQGALQSGSAQPYIDLRAVLQAGCLVIHCINPSVAGAKGKSADPLRSHGLGLDILDRLAKKYDGSLDASCHDGLFDVTLIFRFTA